MAISAQDYQQWFQTRWVGVGDSVNKVSGNFQRINDAFSSWSPSLFVDVTHEGSPDGIQKAADDACQLVGVAKDKLEELQLTDEQREVATANANATIDAAIKTVRQLFNDVDLVRTDLVRSLRSDYPRLYQQPSGYSPTYAEELTWAETLREIDGSNWKQRFNGSARAVRESLPEADSGAKALILVRDEDLTVSKPVAVAMTRDRVDAAVVDNWNEQALKVLKEGTDTVFYEIGDLVIIDAKQPRDQPYLDWAKQQPDINPAAKITMTKKGGAFDSGKIKAVGVKDTASFEAAIKRVSKKKVEY